MSADAIKHILIELMTQDEVAELFDVTVPVLANWRSAGKGPRFVKLGGRVKYRKVDVSAYIDANVRQSTCDHTVRRTWKKDAKGTGLVDCHATPHVATSEMSKSRSV